MRMIPGSRPLLLVAALVLALVRIQAAQSHILFERGDVFVSLETGVVQWRLPDGTLRATLVPRVAGWGEGMAFDRDGNLYLAHWRADALGASGNTVEMFSPLGVSQGSVGRGYNCDPHAIVFDSTGHRYVGQTGCRRSLLKFVTWETSPIEFMPAEDNQGVFWIDLAPDDCTMFYTSYGPNVKRFDTCAGIQLGDFNVSPLPGGAAQDLRVLPDGGVLVSSGQVIARLDAAGVLVRTYAVPGEAALWAGLDLVGDGTFWAANYYSSNVYKFDLATGATLAQFNTGTPPNTAVAVRVMK
jgi:outer membrane protein assembly factor BamB